MKYKITYEDKLLCTCETKTHALLIIRAVTYEAYHRGGEEDMKAADTITLIEEV
jgi:hypothetical protein